jgi:hypothetical protein
VTASSDATARLWELNAEMVRRGLAWAFVKYGGHYVAIEAEAGAKKVARYQHRGTRHFRLPYPIGRGRAALATEPLTMRRIEP